MRPVKPNARSEELVIADEEIESLGGILTPTPGPQQARHGSFLRKRVS